MKTSTGSTRQHLRYFVFACLGLLLLHTTAAAQHFGLGLGLSTPNDDVNSVYNSDKLSTSDGLSDLLREATDPGFHINARYWLGLGGNMSLVIGAAWHRFPETQIEVRRPDNDELLAVLQTTQNIIPISVGIDYPIFRELLGLYLAGDLNYNLLFSSVDFVRGDVAIPFDDSPSDSRVGASVGFGLEFDVKLLLLDLGLKYNHANIIGRETDEPDKTFLTLNLSVIFGGKTKGD